MQVQNGKPVGKSDKIKVNLDENKREKKRERERLFELQRQTRRQADIVVYGLAEHQEAKLVLGKLTGTKEQKRNEAGKRSEWKEQSDEKVEFQAMKCSNLFSLEGVLFGNLYHQSGQDSFVLLSLPSLLLFPHCLSSLHTAAECY